jgi:hypothetical protein
LHFAPNRAHHRGRIHTAADQQQREALVAGLNPGAEECLAEAVAQVMFAARGVGPYVVGYGGNYQSCATAPATQALAQQVVAIAG